MSMPADLTAGTDGGAETPLGRPSTIPTVSATDPQAGGTDSGLSGPLGPPLVQLVGVDLGGQNDPSRIEPDMWSAPGTDSGLATSPGPSLTQSLGVDDFEQPGPPADPLEDVTPGRTSLTNADVYAPRDLPPQTGV